MARIVEIPGLQGYGVTRTGNVYSCRRKWKKGKWKKLKPHKHKYGHLYVMLVCEGKFKTFGVHQLVLTTFVGPCPKGKQCRHMDGDATNNNLWNLKWGTPKQNRADAIKHGTAWLNGNRSIKWKRKHARKFMRLLSEGKTKREAAKELGTNDSHIQSLIKKWIRKGYIAANDPLLTVIHRDRTRKGSGHGMSKLTEDAVREIRRRHKAGETKTSIAMDLKMTKSQIGAIANYQAWKHVI